MGSDESGPETTRMDQNKTAVREPEEPILPRREQADALTVVGLGASAGGVAALQAFFESAVVNSGAAFVVVIHLSHEHESHLAEVLGRATTMPVQQVTEDISLEPNSVYVIPPSCNMTMTDSRLLLSEQEPDRGKRIVIDRFFRTLADAHGPQATGVILSGSGADGMLGLRHIKEKGGLTVAQEPTEAEHEGMPRSAIATGMVDYVLPVREIPAQIDAYWNTSRRMRLPHEAAPSPGQSAEGQDQETSLRDILLHVRSQTGHDFANYKRATVLRRIGRRMQVNNQDTLQSYLDYLRRHPSEVGDLVGDLLISVTQFFRDAASWEALEQTVLPRLIENLPPDEIFRAWVCGCATGEEAYTLAIILNEVALRLERPLQIQIFATDMDTDAIARARSGVYPETIAGDVSPERLRRWFYRQNGQYIIKTEIRESVLFAAHDVLRDTPFSRLNLISCRNLLIYLKRTAQEQIFETFHFSLRPEGRLFLGQSEAVESSSVLFSPTDKLHRVYSRRAIARSLPPSPPATVRTVPSYRVVPILPQNALNTSPAAQDTVNPQPYRASELHRAVLESYAPPSVLVTSSYEILHLSDGVTRFMRLPGGTPTANLLRLVHPDLRIELRTALYTAAADGNDQTRRVRIRFSADDTQFVRMIVRPVREMEGMEGYFLVLFEEITSESFPTPQPPSTEIALNTETASSLALAQQLEDEIARLQHRLRSTVEQYEASVEELKASNEELQAMNEELRSAAEELETGKEELQSVNEELTTVNQELKNRMEELSQTNGDLQNLLASTDIGTIFLDRALCVQRYTPAIEELFNIIPTDIGRPFAHLTHRLDSDDLPDIAEKVLEGLAVAETEVNGAGDRHFLARLRPYRTLEDKINGVVIAFIDITERKRAEAALIQSEERFRLLVDGAKDYAMFLLGENRNIVFWSRGAERVFGWSEAEMLGKPADIIFTPEDRAMGMPEEEIRMAQERGSALDKRWHLRKDGTRIWADGLLTRLEHPTPDKAYVKIARDASDQRRAEEELQAAHDELEARVLERTRDLERLNQEQTVLYQRFVTAQEEERRRISRELHDETGQDLTAILLGLTTLQNAGSTEETKTLTARLRETSEKLAKKVHEIAVTMRPTALDDVGLIAALRTHVEEWSHLHNINADLETPGLIDERFPTEIELTVYRVVQESLSNVLKHARGVQRVSLILHRKGNELLTIIEDDGRGFNIEEIDPSSPESTVSRRLGIVGMKERASQVGGTLTVESTPGIGTAVYLRIPTVRP
jgi:two-component system CheB/CheR fusion protein